jgi:hypothetical protein
MRSIRVILAMICLVCLFVVPAYAAGPLLSGAWNLSYYHEPNHSLGSTQCVVFTKTGAIAGEPLSGTWTMPNYGGGYSGFWIQEGDQVKLWAATTASGYDYAMVITGAMTSVGSMAGDFFAEFKTIGTGSNLAGAWKAGKVGTACKPPLRAGVPIGPASAGSQE